MSDWSDPIDLFANSLFQLDLACNRPNGFSLSLVDVAFRRQIRPAFGSISSWGGGSDFGNAQDRYAFLLPTFTAMLSS
jgi:hypothetical protein